MSDLSPRQLETLRLVADALAKTGRPPTLRELGNALGIRSTNGVSELLDRLELRGLLERDPRVSRGLVLTLRGLATLGVAAEPEGGPFEAELDEGAACA